MADTATLEKVTENPVTETRESTHESERYIAPSVDIFETAGGLTVIADMPGLDSQDIHVSTEKDVLTIKGIRRDTIERDYLYREFESQGYFRQFTLGSKINQAGIKAEYKHGVLRLTLPFAEEVKPRQIEVRVA
ncbi:MAG: Hsp20/alpha crystallin family protein [Candidatus Sumerlaeia bacterium]|nr:Hsp20/alpha crystallin family protein [Candidatus Sumerlaeia bacterium]